MSDRSQTTSIAERLRAMDEMAYTLEDVADLLVALDAQVTQLEEALSKSDQRNDWLARQLDGCIIDADTLARSVGTATARALVGNLRDARHAIALEALLDHANASKSTSRSQ